MFVSFPFSEENQRFSQLEVTHRNLLASFSVIVCYYDSSSLKLFHTLDLNYLINCKYSCNY